MTLSQNGNQRVKGWARLAGGLGSPKHFSAREREKIGTIDLKSPESAGGRSLCSPFLEHSSTGLIISTSAFPFPEEDAAETSPQGRGGEPLQKQLK